MTPNFHAGFVSIEEMPDFLQVGFADRETGTQNYLMLQRAREFDDQDRCTGMAEVYVERNDQGCSGYGGMSQFELFPDRVRVRFDERQAQVMAGIQEMEISFEAHRLDDLRVALRRCFSGFGYYVDHIC